LELVLELWLLKNEIELDEVDHLEKTNSQHNSARALVSLPHEFEKCLATIFLKHAIVWTISEGYEHPEIVLY
jgi:hypothetical protein